MGEQPTIGEQLAAMNVKLDILLAGKDDHESRLRSLESFKWIQVGVALASGGVATTVAQLFIK